MSKNRIVEIPGTYTLEQLNELAYHRQNIGGLTGACDEVADIAQAYLAAKGMDKLNIIFPVPSKIEVSDEEFAQLTIIAGRANL